MIGWGPAETGVGFINPGSTDAFNLSAKRLSLVERFNGYSGSLKQSLKRATYEEIAARELRLARALSLKKADPLFLDLTRSEWIRMLYEVIGFVFATSDLETGRKALDYLYTAAFLEFCREKLADLGYRTVEAVEAAQRGLCVPDADAEIFYTERVERVVSSMAMDFFAGRRAISDRVREIREQGAGS